jgi:microcystin-dependent protein
MRHFLLIIFGFFTGMAAFSQSPAAFKYQAVVRNNSGQVVMNQSVGFKLSILQATVTGTAVYVETQVSTTSQVGLVALEIGNGTLVSGNLSTINWGTGPYFLKVELDVTGGTNYVLMGTSQLLSVPYALYAKTAGNGFSGNYNDLVNKPTQVSTFANDAGYLKTETDPVFGASLAKKITAADTTRWGKKLPVGVAGNLLTYDGTNWVAKDIVTGNTGGSLPFNNVQPYLSLSYCIALQGIFPSRNGAEPFLAEIMLWGGNFAPNGWANCEGQIMSIAQNTALFSLLGTTYGGDGRSTFALPDLRGRVAMHYGQGPGLSSYLIGQTGGTETTTLSISNLPAHNHPILIK